MESGALLEIRNIETYYGLIYAIRGASLSVEVGRGRVEPDTVPAIIAARDRAAARGAAPPHGLTLVSVDY